MYNNYKFLYISSKRNILIISDIVLKYISQLIE